MTDREKSYREIDKQGLSDLDGALAKLGMAAGSTDIQLSPEEREFVAGLKPQHKAMARSFFIKGYTKDQILAAVDIDPEGTKWRQPGFVIPINNVPYVEDPLAMFAEQGDERTRAAASVLLANRKAAALAAAKNDAASIVTKRNEPTTDDPDADIAELLNVGGSAHIKVDSSKHPDVPAGMKLAHLDEDAQMFQFTELETSPFQDEPPPNKSTEPVTIKVDQPNPSSQMTFVSFMLKGDPPDALPTIAPLSIYTKLVSEGLDVDINRVEIKVIGGDNPVQAKKEESELFYRTKEPVVPDVDHVKEATSDTFIPDIPQREPQELVDRAKILSVINNDRITPVVETKTYGPEYKSYHDVPSLNLFYDKPLLRRHLTIADIIEVNTTPSVVSDDEILSSLVQKTINMPVDDLTVGDYRYLVYKIITSFPDPGLSFTWTSKYGGTKLQTKLNMRAIRCVPFSFTDKETGKVLNAGSKGFKDKAMHYRSLGISLPRMKSRKILESLEPSVRERFGAMYAVIDGDSVGDIQNFLKGQPLSFLTEISNFIQEANAYGMEEVVEVINTEYNAADRHNYLRTKERIDKLNQAEVEELAWIRSCIGQQKKPIPEPEKVVISDLITVANFFPGL